MGSLGSSTYRGSGHSVADIPDMEDVNHLSQKLQKEFHNLLQQFTVDAAKLKEITTQFEKELREGLEKDGANIVRLLTTRNHESL